MNGRIGIRIVGISTVYAILLFFYASYTLSGTVGGAFSWWKSLLFIVMASILGGMALYSILSLAKKRFSPGGFSSPPFLLKVGLCMLIIPGIFGFFTLLYKYIFLPGLPWNEVIDAWPDLIPKGIVVSVFTAIVYPLIDHSLDAFSGLQRMKVEAKRIRTQQLHLRFESLRNQISPHFLFNSLNTISSLIYRDSGIADTFIRHLAHLYQSVMHHYDSPTISLIEELKLVRDYGFLMQTRFEDAFSLDVDIHENTDALCLPPLSAQMLVENAVKHNQLSVDKPLQVRLFIKDGYLVVRNNFVGEPGHVKIGNDLYKKPGKHYTSGIGLKNIESRYRFLTRKPIIIRKDDFFTVSIPLLVASDEQALPG